MDTKILDLDKNLDFILELDIFNKYQEIIFITDDNILKIYSCVLNFIEIEFKKKIKKF